MKTKQRSFRTGTALKYLAQLVGGDINPNTFRDWIRKGYVRPDFREEIRNRVVFRFTEATVQKLAGDIRSSSSFSFRDYDKEYYARHREAILARNREAYRRRKARRAASEVDGPPMPPGP